MVGVPADMSLYVTEQIPEINVHELEGENDPVPLVLENATVPVGFKPPDTVAVHVEEDELSVLIEAGMQLTFVDVDPRMTVMELVVAELARLEPSPP